MEYRVLRLPGSDATGLEVAVALCLVPPDSAHSGVLHRDTDGRLMLLHLAWDNQLIEESFVHDYAWVAPRLLPEEADEVRNVCRDVARRKPKIHFSFRLDVEAVLDRDTGVLVSTHAPHGLTCSSFVLAIFNSAEVRLVDLEGWPLRAKDCERYKYFYHLLKKFGADDNHLANIESDVETLRVRPEEVAAACECERLPANFSHCEPRGQSILRDLIDSSSP
jgi:hypothetical protein